MFFVARISQDMEQIDIWGHLDQRPKVEGRLDGIFV